MPVISCGSIVLTFEVSLGFLPNFITEINPWKPIIIIKNKASLNRFKRQTSNYNLSCSKQQNPVDQVIFFNKTLSKRKKRFVLFPEFINYLNDWRYIHRPKEFVYWIANFYPNKINTSYVHYSIRNIIEQINDVIDERVIIREAANPQEANFHYNFFDYTKCPIDDYLHATTHNVQVLDPLYIYPVDLAKKSRYRANGGIHLIENNEPISTIKLNMQQTFLLSNDFIYDRVIYTCIEEKNECKIDLHWTLLHETLHGFGIEHTTNANNPTPPNVNMQSIMHFSTYRVLCHDDIRAIRMVYQLPVKRENAIHDDTCRRDFPMNSLQKFMYFLERCLIILLLVFLIASIATFVLTLIYLYVKRFYRKNSNRSTTTVNILPTTYIHSTDTGQRLVKPHAYLWHDEML